ncbi:unnamed protein product [Leptosia nina]|uniref:Uncharacterized protein n=1 Tax=Leptosia nina TaxID=320188 RepID=A0AAV1JSD6_9NEOP
MRASKCSQDDRSSPFGKSSDGTRQCSPAAETAPKTPVPYNKRSTPACGSGCAGADRREVRYQMAHLYRSLQNLGGERCWRCRLYRGSNRVDSEQKSYLYRSIRPVQLTDFKTSCLEMHQPCRCSGGPPQRVDLCAISRRLYLYTRPRPATSTTPVNPASLSGPEPAYLFTTNTQPRYTRSEDKETNRSLIAVGWNLRLQLN